MWIQTCSDASVSQMWRDDDLPALVDTHALQTPVHPCDESAQAHLTDEGFAPIIAAQTGGQLIKTPFIVFYFNFKKLFI